MNFRRGIVFALLMQVLIVGVDKGGGLILYLICTNHPDQHGFAGLVSTTPFVLMALANLGLASSQVYFMRKGLFTAQQTFATNMSVAVVWGGTVAVGAAASILWLLPLCDHELRFPASIVLPLCAVVPLLLLASYANTLHLATDRLKQYTTVHLVSSLLFLPSFLGCFYLFGGIVEGGDAAYAMAWGRLFSTVLVVALVLWLVRAIVRLRFGFHREYLREGLKYGWRSNLGATLAYLNHRLDLYIIGFVYVATGPQDQRVAEIGAEVGFYSIAVTWAELVWHFPDALRDLFFSKVAASTHEEARGLTPVLTRLALSASLVGGVVVLLMVDPVMGTITELVRGSSARWVDTWSPTVHAALVFLTPGTIAYTVSKVLQADLAGRNRQEVSLRAQWVAFMVMVVLDLILIPAHGALGAAAASSIAYVSATVYTLRAYSRETLVPVLHCLVLRRSDLMYFREIVSAVLDKLRGQRA
ncbi:MAG TPA: polysaccharide biosynthesis C-terminal domain-containing protein [Planctomycetota bacterium]|nr:polysaccharide biosynthesis C-terminal domain-containing protein [Planctomycetota bacterium]